MLSYAPLHVSECLSTAKQVCFQENVTFAANLCPFLLNQVLNHAFIQYALTHAESCAALCLTTCLITHSIA